MKRIAILVSGRGSNFEAIARCIREGRLEAQIAMLLSNRADAAARPPCLVARDCLPSQNVATTIGRGRQWRLAPLKVDLICVVSCGASGNPCSMRIQDES